MTNAEQIIDQTTNLVTATNITSGNLLDSGSNGLVNFTMSPSTDYEVTTNTPDGPGSCFHLCADDATSQILQLNEVLLPGSNSAVSFDSQIGFATSDETARVQVSTNNGADWQDIYTQAGCDVAGQGPECESNFTHHALSLGAFVGQTALMRFEFSFAAGGYSFPGVGQSGTAFGWCLENIAVTNVQQRIVSLVNTTNFTFVPPAAGDLSARGGAVYFWAIST